MKSNNRYSGLIVSDFNVEILEGIINNNAQVPEISVKAISFAQVSTLLIQKDSNIFNEEYEFIVLWTQPQSVISNFSKILLQDTFSLKDTLDEVDQYANLLCDISYRVKNVFIPMWTIPTYHNGLGVQDLTSQGVSYMLMRMNLRLAEKIEDIKNIFFLNSNKWIEKVGEKSYIPKLDYISKSPFSSFVYIEAMKSIKSTLNTIKGMSKKIILLDLDDTLWGGIVGDDGWENLLLGGHDYIGEAHQDFQRGLISLKNRGILLGLISKNEENVALEAIEKNPEMLLKTSDFVGWKINWNDKAKNIQELVEELNLGLQSVVFIDDNPIERDRVRSALPEVLVPEWPKDKTLYKKALFDLNCFDSIVVTDEDRKRSEMYRSERNRNLEKISVGSTTEWLKTLKIKVRVECLSSNNIQRAVQLFNKTNQMNLSTRRLTYNELLDWSNEENNQVYVFYVSDKFGDYGLTGIASLSVDKGVGKVADLLLSCRVMGRSIENTMLYTLVQVAKGKGLALLTLGYIETPKNKPCIDFLQQENLFQFEKHNFSIKTDSDILFPEHIEMDVESILN